jgi:hypothetical protein
MKKMRGHVRPVPNLLWYQTNTMCEVLEHPQVRCRIAADSYFIMAAFAR